MPHWRPYVPVAQRRAKAERKMKALAKKGKKIQPVHIEGRTIARSFWGKGWCDHLESFSDYSNRLPRGRTYARNGSVLHLEILAGRIEAKVVGSEIYNITIKIEPLKKTIWKRIKKKTAGQIGSVLELLQGALSDEVMRIVTDRKDGLFPKPREISLDCSCPDWAVMCKHVAAVLYGVGNRLDYEPELLFLLRDVDVRELIDTDLALSTKSKTDENALSDDQLGGIFGVDLDLSTEAPSLLGKKKAVRRPKGTKKGKNQKTTKAKATATAKRKMKADTRPPAKAKRNTPKKVPRKQSTDTPREETSFQPTGLDVLKLRTKLDLSVPAFAKHVGVSAPTIYRWEHIHDILSLQPRMRQKLQHTFEENM